MSDTKRDMALSELVTTESAYVEDLQAIHTYYVKPSGSSNCLKHSEWSILFANLPQLMTVNRLFLKQLSFVDEYEALGNLFLHFAPEFECYTDYIVSVEDAFKLIAAKEKNAEFQKFLNDCHIKSHQALPLESYLLKPLQRLLKYPLLLKEIIKYTPPENTVEMKVLDEALEQMENLSKNVNEAKRDKEKYNELVAMRRHVAGWNEFGLEIEDTGDLVLDGDVKIVTKSGSLKTYKVRHLMLFQKYILICKSARFFDPHNYILREKLDLATMKIKDLMDQGVVENAWSISCSEGKRTIFHETYEEKEKWMSSVVVELFKQNPSSDSGASTPGACTPSGSKRTKSELENELKIAMNTRKGVQSLLNSYTDQSAFGDEQAKKQLEKNLQELDVRISGLQSEYDECMKIEGESLAVDDDDEWSDFSDDDDDWASIDGESSTTTSVADLGVILDEPELYIAIYSFVGEAEKDLSFEEGEYLYVLEKKDEDGGFDWWLADKDGIQGYVPSTYITPYSENDGQWNDDDWEDQKRESRSEMGGGDETFEGGYEEEWRDDDTCVQGDDKFGDSYEEEWREDGDEREQINDKFEGDHENEWLSNDSEYNQGGGQGDYQQGDGQEDYQQGDYQEDYQLGEYQQKSSNCEKEQKCIQDDYNEKVGIPREEVLEQNALQETTTPSDNFLSEHESVTTPKYKEETLEMSPKVCTAELSTSAEQSTVTFVKSAPPVAAKPKYSYGSNNVENAAEEPAPASTVKTSSNADKKSLEDVVGRVIQTKRLQKQMALLAQSQKKQTERKFELIKKLGKLKRPMPRKRKEPDLYQILSRDLMR